MEDIGDFVVLKQLVTFCPQVLKYIYMYIYYLLHLSRICLIFHMGKFPADMEKTDADQNVKSNVYSSIAFAQYC